MSEIKLALKTSRPLTSCVAGLAMFNILLQNSESPAWWNVLQSLPIVFATMTGFILNDIYDYEKDSLGKLQRPIALGLLSRPRALFYAFLLVACAIIVEGLINQFGSIDILAITLVGVLLYSPLSKRVPSLKGIATAALTLTPIFYASAILNKPVPTFIYFATSIFIIGREILLDTKDFERDMKYGLRTLVAHLGLPVSQYVAWLLMFVGVSYFVLNLANPFGMILSGLGLVCLIIALIIDLKKRMTNGGLTIVAMILCILSIPFAF